VALVAIVLSGCGSDAPEADQLPLASGLEVVAHEVRDPVAHELPKPNYLLIRGTARDSADLRLHEIAYLRQAGWGVERHFEDGSWGVTSPDGKLFAAIGFGLRGYCGFRDEWQGAPDAPHMCSTVVNRSE
jgi:hypothetical protein